MDGRSPEIVARTGQDNMFVKVMVPLGLACWCILVTTALALCLKHQITAYWMLVSLVWGMLLIFAASNPRHVNPYLPLLLPWAFWLSLQTDLQLYWHLLPGNESKDFIQLQGSMSSHMVHVGILAAVAHLLIWIRGRLAVFVLAVGAVFTIALIPKPSEIQVHTMILQAILYCMLYFLSLSVSAVARYARQDAQHFLLNTVIGAAWILWVDELVPLLGLTAVYALACLVTLIVRYETVQGLWLNYDPATGRPVQPPENPPDRKEK